MVVLSLSHRGTSVTPWVFEAFLKDLLGAASAVYSSTKVLDGEKSSGRAAGPRVRYFLPAA
jgi:hypothetical protein